MSEEGTRSITLGGGCFWCLEPVFDQLRGVRRVEPGYAGGHVRQPRYRQVCAGGTGHAEVVRVTWDPKEIDLTDLLRVFFTMHDPTTPNRQGADVGPQYRSAVFWETEDQRETVERVIEEIEAEGIWDDPLVTEVAPLPDFWPAEPEHRDYWRRNPGQAYCRIVIDPKVAKLRKRFSHLLAGERRPA